MAGSSQEVAKADDKGREDDETTDTIYTKSQHPL